LLAKMCKHPLHIHMAYSLSIHLLEELQNCRMPKVLGHCLPLSECRFFSKSRMHTYCHVLVDCDDTWKDEKKADTGSNIQASQHG